MGIFNLIPVLWTHVTNNPMAFHQWSISLLQPIILLPIFLFHLLSLPILLMLLPPVNPLLDHLPDFFRHHLRHIASVVPMQVPLDPFTPDVLSNVPASQNVTCLGIVDMQLMMVILHDCTDCSHRMMFLICTIQLLFILMSKTHILFIWMFVFKTMVFSFPDHKWHCLALGCSADDHCEYKFIWTPCCIQWWYSCSALSFPGIH